MSQSSSDHLFRSVKTAEHLRHTDLALETIGARAGRNLRATQPENPVRRTLVKLKSALQIERKNSDLLETQHFREENMFQLDLVRCTESLQEGMKKRNCGKRKYGLMTFFSW